MRQFELVIVGGGLASARAIKAYREAGDEGTVALLSNDAVLPYHRPPLSEGLPSGRDRRGALRRRRSLLCRQRRRRPTWDFGVRRYPSGALADHAARTTLRLRAAADRHRRAAPALERSRRGARRRVHAALAGLVVDELAAMLEPDDVIIDGGSSYYRDDIDRANALVAKGIPLPGCRHQRRHPRARARLLPDDRRRAGAGAGPPPRPDLRLGLRTGDSRHGRLAPGPDSQRCRVKVSR